MNFIQALSLFGKIFLVLLIVYFGIKGGRKIGDSMRKKKVEEENETNERA